MLGSSMVPVCTYGQYGDDAQFCQLVSSYNSGAQASHFSIENLNMVGECTQILKNQMNHSAQNGTIFLCFGGPVWLRCYDPEKLSDADQLRAGYARAPRAEQDWRVSRAVAAALREASGGDRNTPLSLSHSRGHAVAALAPAGWPIGVDLERCRPRDVDALAQWVCTAGESQFLASLADPVVKRQQFYMLWTLKESLIKAAGLPFPAGMREVGLDEIGTSAVSLRAPHGQWQAMAWELSPDWVAAAVWHSLPDATHITKVDWIRPTEAKLLAHWRSP